MTDTPTAWAYDAACAALHKHRARAEAAEAQLTRYRTVVEECAAPLPFCPLGKSQLQREVELANEFDRRQKLALAALEDGDV